MRALVLALCLMVPFGCRNSGNNDADRNLPPFAGVAEINGNDIGFLAADHSFQAESEIVLSEPSEDRWLITLSWPADAPFTGDTTIPGVSVVAECWLGAYVADSSTTAEAIMDLDIGSGAFGQNPGEATDGTLTGTVIGPFGILDLDGSFVATRQ